MSQTSYVVFGETRHNTTESNYTYANALTIDLMARLGDDERFLDCTQADVVNLGLILLYGFVAPEEQNKVSKQKLKDFINDFEDFKDFAMFTMNICRCKNEMYNNEIDELITKED